MLVLSKVDESAGLNDFPVFYWNHVALEMNRITHSLGGPQGGPTMSSRALGLLHLAMHDAYFATLGHTEASDPPTYLPDSVVDALKPVIPTQTLDDANAALTAAAIIVLDRLYGGTGSGISILARDTLSGALAMMISGYGPHINALSPAHEFGVEIADAILGRLAVRAGEPGADQGHYEPKQGRFMFRDEPVNPLKRVDIDPNNPALGTRARRIYHGPFYGKTVRDFAVTDPAGHTLANWPESDYLDALREVVRLGGTPGQPKTNRTPDQTVAGLYWAYDGANLIGTPPRLYNQILRKIAWSRRDASGDAQTQTSEFVRLFALANTAMADAGKFAWAEKYKYELWRPLSGVREHETSAMPTNGEGQTALDPDADPFWIALGAPETNTNRISFKPPFPAYPSGHATFGAACFQMARLYYNRGNESFDPSKADDISFSFVSEELNGVSRDLRQDYDPAIPIEDQPGNVRTRVNRKFPSLWHAIFENAFSRIYLGVHWRFDAADATDIQNAEGVNKDPTTITYKHVWTQKRDNDDPRPIGGVPLGLGIANDIFANRMRAPVAASVAQPAASGVVAAKLSNTTFA